MNDQIVIGPQIPLGKFYESVLAFFLNFHGSVIYNIFGDLIYTIKFVGTFLSLVFLVGIIYTSFRFYEIERPEILKRLKEEELLSSSGGGIKEGDKAKVDGDVGGAMAAVITDAPEKVDEKAVHARKWQRVVDHAESQNPNDWRLAILEADILLDELLDIMGGHGNTIGDKLKSFTKAEMPNIQLAWEAHLVRNQIAHEGGDFIISQREARRVVKLYHDVLQAGLYF